LLGLTIISISVPAVFADVFTIEDIRCQELPQKPPSGDPCDVTNPSVDVQFMLDTLLIPSQGPSPPGVCVPGPFPNCVSSETTTGIFGIPDPNNPPVGPPPVPPVLQSSLTFTALRDTGKFLYTFGLCPASAITNAGSPSPITNKQQWAVACLGSAVTIFSDAATSEDFTTGSTFVLTVCASGCDVIPGENVFFFLIPNNDVATVLVANPNPGDNFYPSSTDKELTRAPMFMIDEANPGEFDQLLSFVGGGVTLFTWEDKTRDDLIPPNESDEDFTDLAFSVDGEVVDPCAAFPSRQACLCALVSTDFCEIGGEFLEVDSSSLLLAGLQTSTVWILPIVLAGAGTGLGIAAFHLRRK